MFTAEQYRAKAAEFTALLTNRPRSPNERKEFRDLEQTYDDACRKRRMDDQADSYS
jgi:hypothetical protein